MLHLSNNQEYQIANYIAELIVSNNEWMNVLWIRQKIIEYWLIEEVSDFTDWLATISD